MPGKKNKNTQQKQPQANQAPKGKHGDQCAKDCGHDHSTDGHSQPPTPESVANLQNELMSKISAMKDTLLKGGEGGDLGKDMIDNLFKNLLGDMSLPSAEVDRKEYLDTEESHQQQAKAVDETLASIDKVYEQILKGDLDSFPVLVEEDTKHDLTPADEKKLSQEDKYNTFIQTLPRHSK